jgi:2-polyprenyl-3-methyl-5-hydroxy-6-metoxy-1,4-benzoquinol methylase
MIERAEWLKQIRHKSEMLYDRVSPQYWVTFGLYANETHLEYLQKFLDRVPPDSTLLSAACGAGRYDGILLEAGHRVVGIDQSAGMLARAREHFPEVRYEKMGLQEMNSYEEFDGIICMDAMEHICLEDYPLILRNFQKALKPGGVLYFTADRAENPDFDLEAHYERAKALGLPVVFGEVTDEAAYEQAINQPEVSGEQADIAVYHYYPPLEKVREWIDQAGFAIEEEGVGSGLHHFIVRKD